MNIKSLLLGSAAAMVAVSGAQAADAIVVEPEPVEFVRVCDAYGAGFFFIPGTETCLRISGFVRTTFGKEDQEVTDSATGAVITTIPTTVTTTDSAGDTTSVTTSELVTGDSNFYVTRARVVIDARNETDWGTLRSQINLEAGDTNDPSARGLASADLVADVALISLAGFRFGQNGANYWSSNQGFAGVNLEAVGFGTDGFYSFDDSMVFDYTFAADGFAVTVGVENTGSADFSTALGDGDFANFYAGFNYSNEFGDIAFTAAHDADAVDGSGDVGGWAYSISATADLTSFLPGGTLHGYYQWDDDYNTSYVGNGSPFLDEEEAWGVSFQMDLTDEVELILLYNRAEGDTVEGEADLFTVGANWFPAAAPGFSIRGAYSHQQTDETLAVTSGTDLAGTLTDVEEDFFEFTVRRNF